MNAPDLNFFPEMLNTKELTYKDFINMLIDKKIFFGVTFGVETIYITYYLGSNEHKINFKL